MKKKTYGHTRYQILKETAVYDLEENIHVAQSSMNICVKNRLEQNLLFNTSLALAEDQFYIMENSMQKKKIGYVRELLFLFSSFRCNDGQWKPSLLLF